VPGGTVHPALPLRNAVAPAPFEPGARPAAVVVVENSVLVCAVDSCWYATLPPGIVPAEATETTAISQ
jgi:hypothetical protein